MPPLGVEHPSDFPGKTTDATVRGAESGALPADSVTLADPELTRVVAAWSMLPYHVKASILELIGATDPRKGVAPDGRQ